MAKRTIDWFRTPAWPIKAVETSMPLPAKPRLLSRTAEAADPGDFDPRPQHGPGVFTSSFAVGPVWVSVEFGDFSGHLEPIRVEVRGYASAKDDSVFPVTATTLRHIPLSKLVAAALKEHENLVKDVFVRFKTRRPNKGRLKALEQARKQAASDDRAPGTKRGPRPIETTELFNRVIDAYVQACNAGSKRPNVEAAIAVFKSSDSSHIARVVKYVSRAREKGILAKTSQGIKSGKMSSDLG